MKDAAEAFVLPSGFDNWNRSHRGAFLKGVKARHAGEPQDACPYEDHRKPSGLLSWSRAYIRAWHDGWRAASVKRP